MLLICLKILYYKTSNYSYYAKRFSFTIYIKYLLSAYSKILHCLILIVLKMCLRILYDKIANSFYHYAKRYYFTRYQTVCITCSQILNYKMTNSCYYQVKRYCITINWYFSLVCSTIVYHATNIGYLVTEYL